MCVFVFYLTHKNMLVKSRHDNHDLHYMKHIEIPFSVIV